MFVYAAELAIADEGQGRFGIDAHVDKVRWADIRDRIFGRVDPMSVSGKEYREQRPEHDVLRRARRVLGPKRSGTASGIEITADQIVIAAGSRPVIPDIDGSRRRPEGRVHTSDTIMRLDELPGVAGRSSAAASSLLRWHTCSGHSARAVKIVALYA